MSRGFRVWDKQTKNYELDREFVLSSTGELMELYSNHNGTWEYHFADTDRFIIEQYTGLKDKNGKEIYEGDIVKCYSQDTYPAGRVMYSEEWCSYEIVSYDQENCRVYNLESFSPTVNKYLEVIGNIHENPELLKGGIDN